ncbi:peptidoglycan-binding protein [Streptomyces sp. NRRL S-87]|uniref:peptidoglycan-binding domain-containing protein n=1 Tax=Streptomyces sp. NRRL S-87 TaxID=1463920 RepID=UPI00068E4A18|nr:peptidoglycan-binding protein [Streptomyces sp. NRRL S-87]
MPDIEIDTSRLTFRSFTVPEAATGSVDGSTTPPPTVSLPVAGGYHLKQGTGPPSDFVFEVTADGTVDFDASFDAFVLGRGGRRLTVRGLPVRLDATALDQDLLLRTGGFDDGPTLVSGSPHDLLLLPRPGYRLDGGAGRLDFAVGTDGVVRLGPEAEGWAAAGDGSLTVRGRTVRIDGRELLHDLLPTGIRGSVFLSRDAVHTRTVLPGAGYGFQPGAGVVADLSFGVTGDGEVTLDPEYAGFASAEGDTLRVWGRDVRIDGTSLDHVLVPTGLRGNAVTSLPRESVNTIRVVPTLPGYGYGFQPGSGVVADLFYGVTRDGGLALDPKYAGFASVEGNELTVRGRTIRIDGTALSHDLAPDGMNRTETLWLSRTTVNEVTALPTLPRYRYTLRPAPNVTPDLAFGVTRDGDVSLDPAYEGFASADGDTLVLTGYPVVIDATAADSDLVGLTNMENGTKPRPSNPREIAAVLLPGKGYLPRTTKGVFTSPFDVERDGTLTVAWNTVGRYVVTPAVRSDAADGGSGVTCSATVRALGADRDVPEGTLTFATATTTLGSAEVDPQGRARVSTTALPPGIHDIAVTYQGGADYGPSSTGLRHRQFPASVDPATDPAPDPAQPVLLDWAELPVLARMADPHEVDGRVKLAQALLNAAGAAQPPLVVDGNFGDLTQAAVLAFQAGRPLPPTGTITTPDWFALALAAPRPLLEPGPRTPEMTGPPVARVQQSLNRSAGVPALDVDARFGPATAEGVRAFQTRHGLAVTGTVTPETWAALAGGPPTTVPTASMRLTFSYDSADWAAGGPPVRLTTVAAKVAVTAPPPDGPDGPDDPPEGTSGFWYEVRDARGAVRYRRALHQPIALRREVPSGAETPGLSSFPLDAPRGTFELLVPLYAVPGTLVLFSSPLDAARADEAAVVIGTFPLA